MTKLVELSKQLKKISLKAGKAILEIYQDEKRFEVEVKSDKSPLTEADKKSNTIICTGLRSIDPEYPLISEENKEVIYEDRKSYERYWLIDPLDGTKEFIRRNGEFTVNIALIENGQAILGVVYVPVLAEMYWAVKQGGAYLEKDNKIYSLHSKSFKLTDHNLRIVCSRSHLNENTQSYIDRFSSPQKVCKGSSLKFLVIAKGEADVYPRLAPTMEWDTAAAQIVLEEAGGKVISQEDQAAMRYNKPNLKNPYFIAYGAIQ